jgi:hypothetical protein
MEKTKEELGKVIVDIVNESFPELKEDKIQIRIFPNIIKSLESTPPNGIGKRLVFINRGCLKRSRKSLKGQLAHELCHIVLDYYNKGFFSSTGHFIRKFLSSMFNTSFSRKIEVKIEKETIKRGYAREVFSLRKDWKREYGKRKLEKVFYPRGYFSAERTKIYAEKIGKW